MGLCTRGSGLRIELRDMVNLHTQARMFMRVIGTIVRLRAMDNFDMPMEVATKVNGIMICNMVVAERYGLMAQVTMVSMSKVERKDRGRMYFPMGQPIVEVGRMT